MRLERGMADKIDGRIAAFAKKWFAELSGDEEKYDLTTLDGDEAYDTHGTLDAFFDELCELISEVEKSE